MNDMARSLREANKASSLDQPCEQGDDKRSSDLCAQWKAADAAKSASDATWIFGTLGSLIGAFTLAAAWSAAKWARKAAERTAEANKIASKGVELEYRPIMIFSHFEVEDRSRNIGLLLTPVWRNIGRLPAKPTSILTWRGYTDGQNGEVEVERVRTDDVPHPAGNMAIIGAGESRLGGAKMVLYREAEIEDCFPNLETPIYQGKPLPKFIGRKAALFICRIEYTSAIGGEGGEPWHTEQVISYSVSLDDQGRLITDGTYQRGMAGCPAQSMT